MMTVKSSVFLILYSRPFNRYQTTVYNENNPH